MKSVLTAKSTNLFDGNRLAAAVSAYSSSHYTFRVNFAAYTTQSANLRCHVSSRRLKHHLTPLQTKRSQCGKQRDRHYSGAVALFTGIVQGQGKVVDVLSKTDFSSITISFPAGSMAGIQIGASVAINGTCLTVVHNEGDTCRFDIISETLRRTNLGLLSVGSSVNFERSAKMGDEIGGHTVSGHVHCTATLDHIETTENNLRLTFKVPKEWMKYILSKGFIAVDGTSLTVGEVGEDWFCVYLIPETLRVTVLGSRTVGDAVNIEVDAQTQAIVDTVEKVVAQYLADKVIAAK